MVEELGSEVRKYSCLHFGKPYEAYPPDDWRHVATIAEDDFSDCQMIIYTCESCGEENTLFWGAPANLVVDKKQA